MASSGYVYPSSMWSGGMTLPVSGDIGYVQPFDTASGNLANGTGIYPLAVPRIDAAATTGITGNSHILPYSAQLFYTALESIKLEYTARGATEPDFHVFYDYAKTDTEILASHSGLLEMPLQNFPHLVEEAQEAISGLVCMSGWSDSMGDYMNRVFDYRILLADVPSGNRLQDGVTYRNIATGQDETINCLTRARSGLFPLDFNAIKNLSSTWGVMASGTRLYTAGGEFSGVGQPIGDRTTREPEFQQFSFMGHFDWLAQSLLWRPPVVESFKNSTDTNTHSLITHERDRWESASGFYYDDPDDVWWHASGTSPSGVPSKSSNYDTAALVSAPAPSSLIYGDLGYWRVNKQRSTKCTPIGTYVTGESSGTTWELDTPDLPSLYEQVALNNTGSGLDVNTKDYYKSDNFSGYVYNSGTGSGGYNGDYVDINTKIYSERPQDFSTYNQVGYVDPDPSASGAYLGQPGQATTAGAFEAGPEIFETSVSWISPGASGRWEISNSVVEAGSGISYPLGSGSAIVVDMNIDSHNAASGEWTSHTGRNDFEGVHVCLQTNKHIPHIIEKDSNSRTADLIWTMEKQMVVFDDFILFDYVEGAQNEQYQLLTYDTNSISNSYNSDLNAAFGSDGVLASGYSFIRKAPTLMGLYFSSTGLQESQTLVSDGTFYNGGEEVLETVFSGSWSMFGDLPTNRSNRYGSLGGINWRQGGGTLISDSDLTADTEWDWGLEESIGATSYPSGAVASIYSLSDTTPTSGTASGTLYTVDLWDKYIADMDRLATHWPSGAVGSYDVDPDLLPSGNDWERFEDSTDSGVSGWHNAVARTSGVATAQFGQLEDDGGTTIDALSFNQLISNGASTFAPSGGVGYNINSIWLKYPVILGPSGLN